MGELQSVGNCAPSEVQTRPELNLLAAGPENASDSGQQVPRSEHPNMTPDRHTRAPVYVPRP